MKDKEVILKKVNANTPPTKTGDYFVIASEHDDNYKYATRYDAKEKKWQSAHTILFWYEAISPLEEDGADSNAPIAKLIDITFPATTIKEVISRLRYWYGHRDWDSHAKDTIELFAKQTADEAVKVRDLEWWENCILVDNVAPNPQAGKKWLAISNTYHENLIREEYQRKGYKTIEHFQEVASKKYGYKKYEDAEDKADTDTFGKINFEAEEAFNAYQSEWKIVMPSDDEILKLANDYCEIGGGYTTTQDKVNWREILVNGMKMLRAQIKVMPDNAIQFAEWLIMNDWRFMSLTDGVMKFTYRKLYKDEPTIKTTQELYDQFKKDNS